MADRKTTMVLVVHTTATNPKTPLTEKSLRAMHKARGFRDIGYNVWIDRDGGIRRGRGWDKIGAHVADWNSVSFGVAWEGGFKENDITDAQLATLKRVIKKAVKRYPGAKVCGHRDLSPDKDGDGQVESNEWLKLCPWFDAEVWARDNGFPHSNYSGKAGDSKDVVEDGPDKRIRWLQRLLLREGFTIVADGWAGPKTDAAVAEFERAHGLPVTGSLQTRATVDLLKKRAGA